jgi:hypothetical protein
MEDICTGVLYKHDMRLINNVLAREFRCRADPRALRRRMEQAYESERATVTNKLTGESLVLSERRSGSKYVFRAPVVSSLWKILQKPLTRALEKRCHLVDLRPELNHGDVIFYRTGGFFKWHRDSLYECPYPYQQGVEPRNFTFLLGLLDTEQGGETGIAYEDRSIHLFPQTKTQSHFLLFHSDQLHAGEPVVTGVKMVLKLEFWVWCRNLASPCSCQSCSLAVNPGKTISSNRDRKEKSRRYQKLRKLKEKLLHGEEETSCGEDEEPLSAHRTVSVPTCPICDEEEVSSLCQRCSQGVCPSCLSKVDKCPFCRHSLMENGGVSDLQYQIGSFAHYQDDDDDDYDDWFCNGDC